MHLFLSIFLYIITKPLYFNELTLKWQNKLPVIQLIVLFSLSVHFPLMAVMTVVSSI